MTYLDSPLFVHAHGIESRCEGCEGFSVKLDRACCGRRAIDRVRQQSLECPMKNLVSFFPRNDIELQSDLSILFYFHVYVQHFIVVTTAHSRFEFAFSVTFEHRILITLFGRFLARKDKEPRERPRRSCAYRSV